MELKNCGIVESFECFESLAVGSRLDPLEIEKWAVMTAGGK